MTKISKGTVEVKLQNCLEDIATFLDLESSAWDLGFYKREPKKIAFTKLLFSFWKMCSQGKNTLRNWVTSYYAQTGILLDRQSIHERLGQPAICLAKHALHQILGDKIDTKQVAKEKKNLHPLLTHFNRIIIRDSTVQKMHPCLQEVFPGSYSTAKAKAMLRVQSIFNYTEEKWIQFSVGSYRNNDQSAATDIMSYLQPADLLLQDLGYFSLDSIKQIIDKQFIISKWDHQTNLYFLSGERLHITRLMKNKKRVDCNVLVGSEKKIPMRLVIQKLPKKDAQRRRKKAKNTQHNKANHSKEYYEWLGYEIYLTNVDKQVLTPKQIAMLYGLRWHIEILFKAWKSFAHFKSIFEEKKMSVHRAYFTIYAMLALLAYITNVAYQQVNKWLTTKVDARLSILTFTDLIMEFIDELLGKAALQNLQWLLPLFERYATYQKHPKRINNAEKFLLVNELCIKQI